MKANAIPFSIEQYEALVLTGKATVETRDERKARVICTDVKHSKYRLIALVNDGGEENEYSFGSNGKYWGNYAENDNDRDLFIIPNPPRVFGYLNAYSNGVSSVYKTLEEANAGAVEPSRTGIITITEDMIQPV